VSGLAGHTGRQEDSATCTSVHGPTPGPPWNNSRSLELVRAAIDARRHSYADSSLREFGAYAEGYVTYLAEFGGGGQQTVRSDQLALRLRWHREKGSLQTLVGRRYAEWMPTRIHYHIDHLSLYLDNFADRIAIGEGEEVRDVLHPLAPTGPDLYEYRLVDSLQIRANGHWSRTVYRLEVRPRCADSPGLIGTLDLDRDSRAIARLAAGFTPAAYLDPTVSYASVEIENGFVEGRYWLPGAQRVEIRRQVQWMELPFGGTIRTSFRVLDYDLDPAGSFPTRTGDRVASLPPSELERYAGWWLEDLTRPQGPSRADSVRFEDIRRQAVAIAAGRYLGGNSRLRLWIPNVSSGVRYRRAEGLLLGAGIKYDLDGSTSLAGWGGYAFDRGKPEWLVEVARRVGGSTLTLTGFLEGHLDIGPFGAASGAVSSLGAVFRGDDWLDPYWSDGLWLTVEGPAWDGAGRVRLALEDHTSAVLEAGAVGSITPRAVRSVSPGTDLRAELRLERGLGTALGAIWTVRVESHLAGGGDFGYTRWIAAAAARPPVPDGTWRWEGDAALAAATGTTPEQRLLLLGGRGTVPGFEFHGWGGDRAFFTLATLTRTIQAPWIGVRVLAAAGWTELTGVGRDAAERMGVAESAGARASLGGGFSLLWNVIRLDVAHGIDGGEWEWMLSVNPSFRPPL
jgi:hypothetical protein